MLGNTSAVGDSLDLMIQHFTDPKRLDDEKAETLRREQREDTHIQWQQQFQAAQNQANLQMMMQFLAAQQNRLTSSTPVVALCTNNGCGHPVSGNFCAKCGVKHPVGGL